MERRGGEGIGVGDFGFEYALTENWGRSPALRRSPSPKTEGDKQGRSYETALTFSEKDDDLALFNDMDAREKDNFLLTCADEDFDDSISTKLEYFTEFKLAVAIPALGDGSDLLDGEGEKNDYEWLLTPPDTPLFPSLDDETTTLPHPSQRGRQQSKPISIAKSNTMDKSCSSRTSRTSASPNRLSPSPRSTTSSLQSRGRSSSAPNSSFIHPSTSPQRPSTPSKYHNQIRRSSTPTTKRMSAGSSGYSASHRKEPSPVKANCGNSASPKLSARQSNLSGFSAAASPNLQTSLVDHAASYVRGSSPASRSRRDIADKYGRQSTSPIVSRSASSPHSDDRVHISSHDKASVVSSCEGEVESVLSILPDKQLVPPGTSDCSIARRYESFSKAKGSTYSKRTSQPISSSSAPKRSFDSAMRQMDRQKSPQSMFRPLLNSAPSASFYLGQGINFHQHLVSINSTLTSSTNASSELSCGVVPDTDGSDHGHDDMVCGWEEAPFSNVQEEVLAYQMANELRKDTCDMELHGADLERVGADLQSNTVSRVLETHGDDKERFSENPTDSDIGGMSAKFTVLDGSSDAVGNLGELLATCSKCGKKCFVKEILDRNLNICQSCIENDGFLCCQLQSQHGNTNVDTCAKKKNSEDLFSNNGEKQNELCSTMVKHDSLDNSLSHSEKCGEHCAACFSDREMELLSVDCVERSDEAKYVTKATQTHISNPEMVDPMQSQENVIQFDKNNKLVLQARDGKAYLSMRLEASEGAGISLLLTRSSSVNQPVIHGKALSASSIPWDNPGYVTSSLNDMKSLSNASCSSSTDAGSIRQKDACFHRQSSRRSDLDSPRTDIQISVQSGPVSSGVQSCGFEVRMCSTSANQGSSEDAVLPIVSKVFEDAKPMLLEKINSDAASYLSIDIPIDDQDELGVKCKQVSPSDTSALESVTGSELVLLGDISDSKVLVKACIIDNNSSLDENAEDSCPNNSGYMSENDLMVLTMKPSVALDDSIISSAEIKADVDSFPKDCLKSTGDQENGHDNFTRSHSGSSASQSAKDILVQELSTSAPEAVDTLCDIVEPGKLDHSPCYKGQETTKVEDSKGLLSRIITLEEATDTILFCSSIVQSLAYKAASIAIEKEEAPCLKDVQSTVAILGRSGLHNARNPSVATAKWATRAQKPRAKQQLQTKDGDSFNKTEVEVKIYETKIHHVSVPKQADSMKPLKLESKCNCSVM